MTITSTRTTKSRVIPETKRTTSKFPSIAQARRDEAPLSGWPKEVMELAMTTTEPTPTGTSLTLTTIDDEPRILDVDLAERLGMIRPTNIRATIEMRMDELRGYGPLHEQRAMVSIGSRAKREVTTYYLNEEQALLICMFSKTERAVAVRKEVIRVFTAYRRGQLQAPAQPDTPSFPVPQTFAQALQFADSLFTKVEAATFEDWVILESLAAGVAEMLVHNDAVSAGRRRIS